MYVHICMSMCMSYMLVCICCVCTYKNTWESMGVHVYRHASISTWLSACVHEQVLRSVVMQVNVCTHIHPARSVSQRTLTNRIFDVLTGNEEELRR